jgi:hypothetical protein
MSRLPDLERSLARAAQRLDAEEAQTRSVGSRRRRTWRLPLLVAIGTLTLGGGALAALDVLPVGDPVPVATKESQPPTLRGTATVLSVRAPDPEGGPPWGISTFRQRAHSTVLECFLAGRVQNGEVGVVGRDGVFGDDGRFHPLQTRSSALKSCGGTFPNGARFASVDGPPVPASGYSGAPGPPVGGCREHVAASTMSRQTRRRLRLVPVCSRRGLRIVKFGFAGPLTTEVSYGNAKWSRTLRPAKGEDGAYIFVLRPRDAAGGGELTLTVSYSDGTICTQTRNSAPGPGCAPPPGVRVGRTR